MQRWKNLEGTSLPKTGEGVVAACCRQRSSLCGWTIAGLQLLGEQEAAFWVACEPQLRTDTRHTGMQGKWACCYGWEAWRAWCPLWARIDEQSELESQCGQEVWSVMSLFLGLSDSDHQAKLGLWVCQGIYTLYKNTWYTKEVALHMHGKKRDFSIHCTRINILIEKSTTRQLFHITSLLASRDWREILGELLIARNVLVLNLVIVNKDVCEKLLNWILMFNFLHELHFNKNVNLLIL